MLRARKGNKTRAYVLIFAVILISFFSGYLISYLFGIGMERETFIDLLNDQSYYPVVISLINNANKSIHAMIFEIKYYKNYPNSSTNELLRSLIKAKKRGIDVKIIMDELFSDNLAYNFLKNNGVDIRYEGKERVSHAKFIIIDSKIVIVGSTNWSFYSLEKNREANIIIRSPDIAERFEKYFFEIWKEGK